jgi:hypothetical protein
MLRSLGRFSSLADSGHGVCFVFVLLYINIAVAQSVKRLATVWRGRISGPVGVNNFHFLKSFRPSMGSTHPLIQGLLRTPSRGEKRPALEADQVKKTYIYALYTLHRMFWSSRSYLVKHRIMLPLLLVIIYSSKCVYYAMQHTFLRGPNDGSVMSTSWLSNTVLSASLFCPSVWSTLCYSYRDVNDIGSVLMDWQLNAGWRVRMFTLFLHSPCAVGLIARS